MTQELTDIVVRINALRLPPQYGIVTSAYQYDDAMKEYDRCLAMLVSLGPTAANDLVSLLRHKNGEVRYAAAAALREIGPQLRGAPRDQASAALREALQDDCRHVTDLDYHFWEDLPEEYLLYGSASNSDRHGASVPQTMSISEVVTEALQRMGIVVPPPQQGQQS